MGNPDWAHSEPFSTRVNRGINADALRALMSDLWGKSKVADLCKAVQDERIPISPLNKAEDVFNDPHLRERGIFVRFPAGDDDPGVLAPGMPFKPSNFTSFKPARAPRLGEHNRAVFERDRDRGPPARSTGRRQPEPRRRAAIGWRPRAGLHLGVGGSLL